MAGMKLAPFRHLIVVSLSKLALISSMESSFSFQTKKRGKKKMVPSHIFCERILLETVTTLLPNILALGVLKMIFLP